MICTYRQRRLERYRSGLFCILLFCCGGNSCHTDLRVGQQDTDERVPEHMRVKSLNPGMVSD